MLFACHDKHNTHRGPIPGGSRASRSFARLRREAWSTADADGYTRVHGLPGKVHKLRSVTVLASQVYPSASAVLHASLQSRAKLREAREPPGSEPRCVLCLSWHAKSISSHLRHRETFLCATTRPPLCVWQILHGWHKISRFSLSSKKPEPISFCVRFRR